MSASVEEIASEVASILLRRLNVHRSSADIVKLWYDFSVRGQRFRVSVPDATTKWQAEQAEAKAKNEVFEGRFGREPSTITLKEFVEKAFLPWAKAEKRSWRNDVSRSKPILAYFRDMRMRDITQDNVREFKKQRRDSFNGLGSLRAPHPLTVRFSC